MQRKKKGRIMSVVTVVAAEKLIIAVPLPWQRDRPGGVEGRRVVCVGGGGRGEGGGGGRGGYVDSAPWFVFILVPQDRGSPQSGVLRPDA